MSFNLSSAKLSALATALGAVHTSLREAILQQCRAQSCDSLAQVVTSEGEGDETFAIDLAAEELLPDLLERALAPLGVSMLVLFEGQTAGPIVIPRGSDPATAQFISLWDPLDGSRMLAYQLHSGWILTAIAPNRGAETLLSHAVIALQTEVPTLNQRESAELVAIQHGGERPEFVAHWLDGQTGTRRPCVLHPSPVKTLQRGFVAHEGYFEGTSTLLAELESEILLRALGPSTPGAARVWRDAQITSAGTLFNLLSGKIRWAHDFRPLLQNTLAAQGEPLTLCAHPYDLCTAPLLCQALNVVLTDPLGETFDAPFSVTENVAWCGYANRALADQLIPIVRSVLQTHLSSIR